MRRRFLRENPKAAAAATRAMLKGAKWVNTNPAAAARLSVEKKYILSSPELNAIALPLGLAFCGDAYVGGRVHLALEHGVAVARQIAST